MPVSELWHYDAKLNLLFGKKESERTLKGVRKPQV